MNKITRVTYSDSRNEIKHVGRRLLFGSMLAFATNKSKYSPGQHVIPILKTIQLFNLTSSFKLNWMLAIDERHVS